MTESTPALSISAFKERNSLLIAGVCSGITKTVVGHPFDTLKVRLQNDGGGTRFKGAIDCFLQTLRKESFFGLYKGASPPLFGFILMDSVQMGTLANARFYLQSRHQDTPLTTIEHSFAGLCSGITVAIVSTPIEQLKVRLQIQYNSKIFNGPFDCARKIVKSNGILALWTGFAPCLLFRSFFFVLWGSYDVYTKFFQQHVKQDFVPFIAGGCAANTFWAISYPADVVKCRMMTEPYNIKQPLYPTITSCFKSIYKLDGFKGFYRGFLPCMVRSFPTNGAAILVYEFVVRRGKFNGPEG